MARQPPMPPGTVVRLKSGGVPMTVMENHNTSPNHPIDCIYYNHIDGSTGTIEGIPKDNLELTNERAKYP